MFTRDLLWFEIFLSLFITGVLLLPKLYRSKALAGRMGFWDWLRRAMKGLSILVAFSALIGIFAVEGLFVRHAWLRLITRGSWSPTHPSRYEVLAVWIGALVVGIVARWFLIEFAGDVAIYVSGYKLSKWDEVRNAIKDSARRVAEAVYGAREGLPTEGKFLYENVMVVGHSLGSVISYDTLNRLVLDDEIAAAEGRHEDLVDVVKRTRVLLTFGSPLDKTAFLFRTKGNTDELREAAAAAWQPLIREYAFRPAQWINIYSWADIISGKLHFYDNPANSQIGGTKRVDNKLDHEAWVPLAAHTEYWHNQLLGDTLYANLAKAPAD